MSEYKLSAAQLNNDFVSSDFKFPNPAELEGGFELSGQERGLAALEFGLDLKEAGYNIYLLNFSGPEEKDYIRKKIKQRAKTERTPPDLCYVHNFKHPQEPLLLKFPPGAGEKFKSILETEIQKIKDEANNLFKSDRYNQKKRKLKKKYQAKMSQIIADIKSEVKDMGYLLVKEEGSFSITPLMENEKPMSEEEYNNLTLADQEQIEKKVDMIKDRLELVFTELDDLEEEYEEKLSRLNENLVEKIIERRLNKLYEYFAELTKVISYLNDLKADLLDNIDSLKEEETEGLILFTEEEQEDFSRYEVNLIVDNSSLTGAPVISGERPTYYNLLGRVEYENLGNGLKTSFKKIKGGALHQAKGGYLILEAEELLSNFKAWPLLKQVLKSGEIKLENLGAEYEQLPLTTLDPQTVETDLKVILLGSPQLYYLLTTYDPEFEELFKIKADFDICLTKTEKSINKLAQFVSYKCQQKDLLNLDAAALGDMVEHLSRQAENQKKMVLNYSGITDLLAEADLIARKNNNSLITAADIRQVREQRKYRHDKYQARIKELYANNKILLNTKGTEIGVLNGLSIIDLGDYSFGRPTKITAAVYRGEEGIVNIEREVNTSGKIHDKGIFILESYLRENFAQDLRLQLTAHLCFEQLYTGIDGDSASAAELYALLSALAKLPLKQGIAVTGSINQKGLMQPVGGVIEKIEGFFEFCLHKGLTGEQGVIIPAQNKDDLVLAPQVIEAVKEDKFSLYAINNVSEGLRILTDLTDVQEKIKDELQNWV